MALTTTEEALVRQLLNQQAAILSLAGKESTITSKLGATKVTLANLVAASSVADADLLLTRQGTTDKSVRADILAAYMGAELGASFAPIASPALTGTPTVPTAADGTNTTQIASTAFVQSAVGGYLSKSAVGGTVTLSDLEASNPVIGFSGALTSNLVVVVPTTVKRLWAINNATSGAFTLTVKTATGSGVTVAQGKRNLVYTDGKNVYDGFNDFESIALTGAPTVPTAATGTNTTQIASTAFVQAALGDAISAGAVLGFAMAAAPTGWLKCNGAAVSRTTYAKMFAAIGTTFGAGNGSTTFNLPDLRGEFIRGFDDGRGVDPGRALGSAQGDAIRNITGYIRSTNGAFYTDGATGAFSAIQQGQRASNDPGYVGYSGLTLDASLVVPTANENRPRNVAMLMCIKY